MPPSLLGHFQLAIIAVYLVSLLGLGYIARRYSKEASLNDFYLAGGSLGFISLFFTFYATQYSGNTLFGLPGEAYREGPMALAFMLGMMCIVLVYHIFAPRLHILSRQHSFISVGDFIAWRYRSRSLLVCVNAIVLLTLINYILANLKAVGLLMESASDGVIPFALGVIAISAVMAFYETLGGMRGVIWTDVIQGGLLIMGCLLVFLCLAYLGDSALVSPAEGLPALRQQFSEDPSTTARFASLVVLIALAAAVYPQAIQRIYAARNLRTLQRSYWAMFFMPIIITLPMIVIGMSAVDWYPGLSRSESETVIVLAIERVVQQLPQLSWLLVLFLAAAIAAIMSTVDSALLSMGATISKDIIATRYPQLESRQLHSISKRLCWLLVAIMAGLAISLPQTIWAIMVLKLELLVQIAPAIILGLRYDKLRAAPMVAGIISASITLVMMKMSGAIGFVELNAPLGIHAGIWCLGLNLLILAAGQAIAAHRPTQQRININMKDRAN